MIEQKLKARITKTNTFKDFVNNNSEIGDQNSVKNIKSHDVTNTNPFLEEKKLQEEKDKVQRLIDKAMDQGNWSQENNIKIHHLQ